MQKPLLEQLRTASRPLHEDNKSLPYFQEMLQGRIRLECYVTHLRAMAVILAAFESGLSRSDNPHLILLRRDYRPKLRLLQQDLLHFRRRIIPDVGRAMESALTIAADIRLKCMENPVALIGHFYVLEGSSQGARLLVPHIQEGLGLDDNHGLAYLTGHGHSSEGEWWDHAERLNRIPLEAEEREAAVNSAVDLFQGLLKVFQPLHPVDEDDLGYRSASLNPEAGTHPVPRGPAAMDAVLRASERALAECPYFVSRYGLRGLSFSDSDGAWLACLPDLDQQSMYDQVGWLGEVLAARGMPRILLQRHLEMLAEELGASAAENKDRCKRLLRAAERIDRSLRRFLAREKASALSRSFEERAGPARDGLAREIGRLVVAAAVDEADGLSNAVHSLVEWAASPERFSGQWIEAVHDLVARARREIGEGSSSRQ